MPSVLAARAVSWSGRPHRGLRYDATLLLDLDQPFPLAMAQSPAALEARLEIIIVASSRGSISKLVSSLHSPAAL